MLKVLCKLNINFEKTAFSFSSAQILHTIHLTF